jgi:uncharacterized Zn-finger protein
MSAATAKKTEQGARVVQVTRADLPLSCPRPGDSPWSLHPRVFLPVEKSGEERCPYCGTRYLLES